MKVVTVLGTRPEIIKLSPLLPLLSKEFDHIIIHTGQHYDYEMDAAFFDELKLPKPTVQLGIGSSSQGKQTAAMLEKIEFVLLKEKPDLVIVQGDTNSTLSGALAASKLKIPIVHIEAGCRSFDRNQPEEINRVITDRLSTYLFAPDETCVEHLKKEGIVNGVFCVGNTSFDACMRNKELIHSLKTLESLSVEKGKYVVVTIHRAENTDDKNVLENIMGALNELSLKIDIVFPMHPRTKKAIEKFGVVLHDNIKVVKPFSYLPFLHILSHAAFCISDSGGIQEEALVCNVPCLIPRDRTEWMGLVEKGKNFLVGTSQEGILNEAKKLVDKPDLLQSIKNIHVEYPQNVAQKIVEVIKSIK